MDRGIRRLAAVVALVAAAGCGEVLVVSQPAIDPNSPRGVSQGTGVYYFLPMAVAEVELVQDVSTGEATRKDSKVVETLKDLTMPEKSEKKTVTEEITKKETTIGLARFRLDLKIVLQPDPSHLYFARVNESAFSNDTVVVELTEKGLLKAATAKLKDERGAIAAKLGELAVQAARAATAMDAAPSAAPTGPFKTVVNLLKPDQVAKLEGALKAATSMVWKLSVEPMSGTSIAAATAVKCTDCDVVGGFLFRPLLPYQVTWTVGDRHAGSTIVLLPNAAPVLKIDLRRAAFVEKETKISFNEGLLTKYEVTKPSQALGFMQIPIDLAKTLVSIPAELLRVKLEQAQGTRDIEQAQRDLLKAQTEAIKAGREKQIEEGKKATAAGQ